MDMVTFCYFFTSNISGPCSDEAYQAFRKHSSQQEKSICGQLTTVFDGQV